MTFLDSGVDCVGTKLCTYFVLELQACVCVCVCVRECLCLQSYSDGSVW